MRIRGEWAIIAMCLGALPGWAEIPESASSAPREQGVGGESDWCCDFPPVNKLGRGISNTCFGWLELPMTVGQRYAPADAGTSMIVGVIDGVFRTAVRTVVGVYETGTFLIPVPEDYTPILPTIGYFQRTPRRQPLLFE